MVLNLTHPLSHRGSHLPLHSPSEQPLVPWKWPGASPGTLKNCFKVTFGDFGKKWALAYLRTECHGYFASRGAGSGDSWRPTSGRMGGGRTETARRRRQEKCRAGETRGAARTEVTARCFSQRNLFGKRSRQQDLSPGIPSLPDPLARLRREGSGVLRRAEPAGRGWAASHCGEFTRCRGNPRRQSRAQGPSSDTAAKPHWSANIGTENLVMSSIEEKSCLHFLNDGDLAAGRAVPKGTGNLHQRHAWNARRGTGPGGCSQSRCCDSPAPLHGPRRKSCTPLMSHLRSCFLLFPGSRGQACCGDR
ncbi:uncharacterized protein LOC132337106 [Haemorhous mexicanus]|uniref:uncharacterized protein LOC132337106 n=1 Tax=Haemorhous mexicanus TaxID=30427 RepID=UPI0028BE2D2A|nr:uncharacterized protein LOC132337106 [Haemorhous mexicanus]